MKDSNNGKARRSRSRLGDVSSPLIPGTYYKLPQSILQPDQTAFSIVKAHQKANDCILTILDKIDLERSLYFGVEIG